MCDSVHKGDIKSYNITRISLILLLSSSMEIHLHPVFATDWAVQASLITFYIKLY